MRTPDDENRADYEDLPRPNANVARHRTRWSPEFRRRVARALIGLSVLVSIGLVWAYVRITEAVRRVESRNALLQIGISIHNYNDTYGELPKNTYRADGTPLLSWRVHLLPFLEQDNLYRRFNLDEPWDSPHNRTLLDQMPAVYARPGARRQHPDSRNPGHT